MNTVSAMMDSLFQQVLSQLTSQLPVLIVYAVGLAISLSLWGRHPRACLPAFLGSLVLLAVSVGFPFVQMSLINNRSQQNWSVAEFGRIMTVLAVASSTLRAVGYGLLIWAVFAGRARQPSTGGFPVGPASSPPRPPPPFPPRGH